MANTALTTIKSTKNSSVVSTATAATADTADLAEVFDVSIDKDAHGYIEINNVSGANGTVTFSLAAGEFWEATSALTGSVAQGVSKIIQVDSARYKKKTGKMALTITPATGKKLKTDHTLTVKVVQLA